MIKKQYVKYDREAIYFDPALGMTHQADKDSCDINILIDTWMKTGVMPVFGTRNQPAYVDVTTLPSYEEAMNLVAQAEQAYAQLPPEQMEMFEDALDYLEAVYAHQEQVGTVEPLDVTVPTDRISEQNEKGGNSDGEALPDESA